MSDTASSIVTDTPSSVLDSTGVEACHAPHQVAWRSLARTHAAVSGRVQEALSEAGLPPLAWFEVLSTVAEADGRMKMGELAEALVITRGGLTKLVDRLVKAGLLERVFCESDRRATYASLLPAGTELLKEMLPVVSGELQGAFAANISVAEAEQLTGTLERVRGGACNGG
ncbi:MAG TPA: MarR family transcriptional regulator [Solirubrobacterales bacterium]|jgi:DNA-binding MarR family transcriptional regulator